MMSDVIMEEDEESKENSSEMDDRSQLISKNENTPSGSYEESKYRSSEEISEGEGSEGEGTEGESFEGEGSEGEGVSDSQETPDEGSISEEGSQSVQHEGGEGESPPVGTNNQMFVREEAQPMEMGFLPGQNDIMFMDNNGKENFL